MLNFPNMTTKGDVDWRRASFEIGLKKGETGYDIAAQSSVKGECQICGHPILTNKAPSSTTIVVCKPCFQELVEGVAAKKGISFRALLRQVLDIEPEADQISRAVLVIGSPAADGIWDYLYEKTNDPAPAIEGLTPLGIPPAQLRKLLVNEVMAHWPGRMPRLVQLLRALKEAGLVDDTVELPV